MNTRTFIQKLRRYARGRNLDFSVKKYESKGSHRRVYLGDRSTTVPWTSNLKPGLVHAVLKQLGIKDPFPV